MKETPILMQTNMVKAVLDGRKTQTRRVIKPQIVLFDHMVKGNWKWKDIAGNLAYVQNNMIPLCPYGQAGDRLWVREAWNVFPMFFDGYNGGWEVETQYEPIPKTKPEGKHCLLYKATHEPEVNYRPSIHMPRWASRITLEITDVRVERVQEINWQDCRKEGIKHFRKLGESQTFTGEFERLWDSINAKRGYGWEVNPWVWVVSFKVV